MPRKRVLQVGDEIKRVLSKTIQFEINDPKLAPFTTITDVDMSNDLSVATCYVSVFGTDKQKENSLVVLKKAQGFFKTVIAKEMYLRIIPELRFELDQTVENGMKMDALIDRAIGKNKVSDQSDETK